MAQKIVDYKSPKTGKSYSFDWSKPNPPTPKDFDDLKRHIDSLETVPDKVEEVQKPVEPVAEKGPSLWERANTPLSDLPSRAARKISEYIDPNDPIKGRSTSGPRAVTSAFIESLGGVGDSMTSPVNLAMTAVTGGAGLARGAATRAAVNPNVTAELANKTINIARGLRATEAVGSAGIAAEGAHTAITNPENRTMGLVQMGLGALGAYGARKQIARLPENLQRLPDDANIVPFSGAPSGSTGVGPAGMAPVSPITGSPSNALTRPPLAGKELFDKVLTGEIVPRLPAELSKAAPRYKFHQLNFESDLDRAAYISAQSNLSRRDADYVKFVVDNTGLTPIQVRQLGSDIRKEIRNLTDASTEEVTNIPTLFSRSKSKAEVVAPIESIEGAKEVPVTTEIAKPHIRLGKEGLQEVTLISPTKDSLTDALVRGYEPIRTNEDGSIVLRSVKPIVTPPVSTVESINKSLSTPEPAVKVQEPEVVSTFKSKLYQGRGKSPEEIYGPEAVAQNRAVPIFGKANYFSMNQDNAKSFGDVSSHDVELRNPLTISTGREWAELVRKADSLELHSTDAMYKKNPTSIPEATERLQNYVRNLGHDGVIVKNTEFEKRLRESFGNDQVIKFNEMGSDEPQFSRVKPVDSMTAPRDPDAPSLAAITINGKRGLKASANINRSIDEVSSAYSRDLESIMIREGIQNSLDAVRSLGTEGAIDVKMAADQLTIKDNGPGMTYDILSKALTEIYGTGKLNDDGAAGGKGIGAASYLFGGKYFKGSTVTRESDGKLYKYDYEGTPDQIKEGIEVNEEVMPEGTPTGTTFTVEFRENARTYMLDEMLTKIGGMSRGLTAKITKNADSPDYSGERRDFDLTTKGSDDTIISTKHDFGTNGVEIRVPKEASTKVTANIMLHVLNKGMYQYTDSYYIGENAEVPSDLIVDISPKSAEGTPDYPFDSARENLKKDLKDYVEAEINRVLVDPRKEKRASTLKELYDSMSKLPGVKGTVRNPLFLDPGNRLTPRERAEFVESDFVKELVFAYDAIISSVLYKVNNQVWKDRLEGVGMVLDPGMHGVHIPNPSTKGDDRKSSILINPFIQISSNKSPIDAAFESVITILHEVAHIGDDRFGDPKFSEKDLSDPRVGKFLSSYLKEVNDHGDSGYQNTGHAMDFVKRLGEVFSKFGVERTFDAVDRISTVYGHWSYSPEVQRLLQRYTTSRGRDEVTPDLLSPTGVKSKAKGQNSSRDTGGNNKGHGSGTTGKSTGSGFGKGPVGLLRKTIREARPARDLQEAMYTAERNERIKRVKSIKGEGMDKYRKRRAAMSGEYEKFDFEPIRDSFTDEEIDHFVDMVYSSKMDEFKKDRAVDGLNRIFDGKIPPNNELNLLDEVFGSSFGSEIIELHGGLGGVKPDSEQVMQVLGVPRQMKTALDAGTIFRQGLLLISEPSAWKAAWRLPKHAISETFFQGEYDKIKADPLFDLAMDSKLGIGDLTHKTAGKDDAVQFSLLEKIPYVGQIFRGSNRNAQGFLNDLRFGVFKKLYNLTKKYEGIDMLDIQHQEMAKKTAHMINVFSGKGKLPDFMAGAAPVLNAIAFSPQIQMARAQLFSPATYVGLSRSARLNALKNVLVTGTITATILGLYTMMGGEIEDESTSTDFGKMRAGKSTRIDIFGGFQQEVVLVQRLRKGFYTSLEGKKHELNKEGYGKKDYLDIIGRYAKNKESPIAALVHNIAIKRGRDNLPIEKKKEMIGLFTPMVLETTYDLFKKDPEVWELVLPNILGASVQVFDNDSKKGNSLKNVKSVR